MRSSLGARLALAFATLAALTALVTSGVSAFSTNRQINSDVDGFLQTRSLDIAEGRRLFLPGAGNQGRGDGGGNGNKNNGGNDNKNNDDDEDSDKNNSDDVLIEEVRSLVESDAEVSIYGPGGEVIVGSRVGIPFDEVDATYLEFRGPPRFQTVEIRGEEYRMITRHIEGGGLVQVARSLSSTNMLLGNLRSEILVVGIAMSALAGLVGFAIATRTTKPLRRLTATVESVAKTQDLSTPIRLDRTDEIGRLSDEFDELLKTLAASRDQQQRLVQDAAHELRTPLTSVRANIDFLDHASELSDEDRQTTLASIKTELGELSAVLAEVVELATESAGASTFETVDLASVADAALAQFELRSARPVVRNLAPSEVQGDHAMLVRAAQNLIGNADKYSPDDEPITVTVAEGEFWVADNGPGIEPSERVRVFDRFYRSDRDRSAPGSGLGLAIVAKIAQEHGGTVWARESDSGGAKVGFTLPSSTHAG